MTSNASSRQTPASGQAVTLRTAFPQASRVVMPTEASRRMIEGPFSMWMKWSWKSCRVVTWAMPSEYSSASSAMTSSCGGLSPPKGILIRSMPGASQMVPGPLVGLSA